jgi:hypothetical protein
MESIGPILGRRGPTLQEEKFTAAFSNDPIVCHLLRSSALVPLLKRRTRFPCEVRFTTMSLRLRLTEYGLNNGFSMRSSANP